MDRQDFAEAQHRVQLLAACAAGATLMLVSAGPTLAAPDIELGRYLSRECETCHRGASATSTIPNIVGMAESRFADRVKAYREKRLDNAVMQNIAERLKDEEIEALAAYFARMKQP